MRWVGAAGMLFGICESWKALYAASRYGFHPWVTVVEQAKGRIYEVPLFEALAAGAVWLIVGALLFCWEPFGKMRVSIKAKPRSNAQSPKGRTEVSPEA
jgi:hypothetical protein